MDTLKTLSKIFNTALPFTDFLYLLQQEEYSLQRVWFWFPRFFFQRNIQKRDHLVYTQRVKITLFLSVFFFITLNFLIYAKIGFSLIIFILTCFSIPVLVLISNFLLAPIYNVIKRKLIRKAGLFFEHTRGNTKVIAITGSYGKTTVKNFIEQFVKYSYRTQMIPGNINSTIGIANWILNNFQEGTEVLIVEMDSYVPKRIRESALLVKPDIAILTNIGDQHLERYKTKENLACSLFELFQFSPENTIKITDEETKNYLKEKDFDTTDLTLVQEDIVHPVVSGSNNKNLLYALLVSSILKIPTEYTEHISTNLIIPERRQLKKKIFGFDGIDDSYNISFITACAGITEAYAQSMKDNKKLLVITAGIPELGPYEKDRNQKLGEFLHKKADKVFVLKSIYYTEILSGINDTKKSHIYSTFSDAIKDLQRDYSPKEWFILIQPELTDMYY